MNSISPYEYNWDNSRTPVCWRSRNDTCSPHFHNSIEIIYVTEGLLEATLNGQLYPVPAGHLLIVPSYTVHSFVTPKASLSYVYIVPMESVPTCKPVLTKKVFPATVLGDSPVTAEIVHCIESIYKALAVDDLEYRKTILKGYSYVVISLLMEQIGLMEMEDSKLAARTQEILIYLQTHYLEPLTLEQVAAHFGYSKSRFSHIFNHHFGCKLIEYINGLRCHHALEMMNDESLSITDIALASGFESTRTFYRAFQKSFGASPSQYKDAPAFFPVHSFETNTEISAE